MKQHPVGSIWEATDAKGESAYIELKSRDEKGNEFWSWSCSIRSFYGCNSDWGRSYKGCRDDITYNFASFEGVRFKRIK